MKKIKMFAAAALFCAAAFAGYTAYEQATMTDQERMFKANLEALTNSREGSTGYLNGPQEEYDCPGWGTGNGYRCAATNSYNCSQILCD